MAGRARVLAVIGGQYGSEGKGVIVNKIADEWDVHVRTGGPNAGHSFFHRGEKRVMQVIPCGWTNRRASLVIGRGAIISAETLLRELYMVEDVDSTIWNRVHVDVNCGIIDPDLHNEGHTDGELHKRIGSTGEGVGAARIARIQRDPKTFYTFGELIDRDDRWKELRRVADTDTALRINKWNDNGRSILLEGTQGSGLSLIHGPWPTVTSADTNAATLAADCGLAPHFVTDVMVVFRSMPIRVAGPSGPLKDEVSWAEVSRHIGLPVEERTTVTKKVRRIGKWDWELADRAVLLNRPTELALTFADYIDPSIAGAESFIDLSEAVMTHIEEMETRWGVEVTMVSTGGAEWAVARKGQ